MTSISISSSQYGPSQLQVPNDSWELYDSIHRDLTAPQRRIKKPPRLTLAVGESLCEICDAVGKISLEDGNYCCGGCNTVVCRNIDYGAEWRYYGCDDNKSSDPTRCGMPTSELLPDSSLGSRIGYSNNETFEVRMMRKYDTWNSMTYRERSLYAIFDTLTTNAVNNGISKSIVEEAKMLYKQVSETKISRGDNRNGLIASSIYISCKNNKVPRSCKEIAKIFNLKATTMSRGCKKFSELMKLNMDATTADDFISRFCSRLGLDNDKKTICRYAIKMADELSIVCENTPPSVAAGAIYLCNTVHGWNLCKKSLAEVCDISQVTINKVYKKMLPFQEALMNEEK